MNPPGCLSQWPTDNEFSGYFPLVNSPVEFYREKIIIRIVKDVMDVKGIYYFRNNTGKPMKLPLVYPFPVDEFHGVPDSVSVEFDDSIVRESLDFRMFKNGEYCGFTLPLNTGADNLVTISYRQRLKGSTARYILTTTAKWGQPFELAEYEIFISENYNKVNINYSCRIDHETKGGKHYYFTGKNFMPDKDLIIKWK